MRFLAQGLSSPPTPTSVLHLKGLALAGGQRGRTCFQPSPGLTPGGYSLSDRASLSLIPRAPVCPRPSGSTPSCPHAPLPHVFCFKLGTPCSSGHSPGSPFRKALCSGPLWAHQAHPPSSPALLHWAGRFKWDSSLLGPRGQASSSIFQINKVKWRKGGQNGCQNLTPCCTPHSPCQVQQMRMP